MVAAATIKKGYKHTSLGVIPEDWSVRKLGEVGKFKGGSGFPLKYQGEVDGEYPFYKVSDMNNVGNQTFMSGSNNWVNEKIRKEMNFVIFPEHSIVFAKIGAAIFLERKKILSRNSCMDNNMMGFIFDNNLTDYRFLHYLFLRIQMGKLVSATALPSLNGKQIAELNIAFPNKPEQTVIATVLSGTDALIECLEKLIAKKKAIKQGAMQQLLIGKKRLPGFNGKWEVKKLGDIAHIVMGQSPRSEFYNVKGIGLPLIQGNADIEKRKTIERVSTSSVTKKGVKGNIIMSVRAPVGEISKATFDCCLGRGVCSIDYKNDYLYHYLIDFEKSWIKFSKGSTFDSVNSKEVNELEVLLPSDDAEQTAIATVLSDMDAEIESLEQKRDKYTMLKQGMMQVLLIGKTRLV